MPFLFKLSQRVARTRTRSLLVAAAVVVGACVKELASPGAPAGGTAPVTIQLSTPNAAPGGSVTVVLRATQSLAGIQETVVFDPQRLRYEHPGDGPDLVVVNAEAAAQGSLRVLASNPQGLTATGVTLVFTVTASGYSDGVRGTVELALAPDDGLVWGAAPSAPARVAGAGQTGGYRFGDANLDGLINLWDVLLLARSSSGATLTGQPFLLGNVRPINGGAAATSVPPCDPATTCRPGVTPADAQNPNGRIEPADVSAVASRVVGISVPVVGELAPTEPGTPPAVASVTISPATGSIWLGQTLQLTATPKDAAGGTLIGRAVTWTSSNTSVATVNSNGLVTGGVVGTTTITATSEGKAGSATLTVSPVPVASVALSPATASIRIAQTVQLTATPKDSAGGTLSGRTVTWASGDTTVVIVSPAGLVTGVAPGSAPITAMSEGKSSTATITVTTVPVASVAISPATAGIRPGQTLQLAATTTDSSGGTLTGRTVTWASSNTSVATINGNGLVTGGVAGTTTITATSEGKTGNATLTVTVVPVASVAVSPATASIRIGQAAQLTATPKDSAGGTLAGRTMTWGSSDTIVARVSSSGQVTGVAAGSATITATSEGKSGTAGITVTTVPVASVAVSPATASVAVGQTVQLTATPKDSAGGTLTGRTVTWTSSNTSVASVSGSGLVTSNVAGTATITATSEGRTGSAAVTVTLVPVASVAVSPATASIRVGQTVQLTATPKDSAGATLAGRTVTWASGDTTVARVSPTGLVTGVAAGSATVTAMSEGKSSSATITVVLVPVASVTVAPASGSLQVGQTSQLTATLKDSAGGTLTGRTVTWTSSNTGVATVNTSGRVTAVAAGTATITATSEGKTGTAAATVTLVPVASVTVSPAPATLPLRGTVQLAVTLKDANGTTLTGRAVAWTSSATTIATVSPSGLVTDVADGGTTTITATSEGKSGTSVVTVQAPPPVGGSLPDPTLLPVASGQLSNPVAYLALGVPGLPAGASYQDPVTGVRVWKVTSSSTPAGNSGAGHDYSDGPNEVSLGWGAGNNTHTILIGVPQGAANYYLVDFTRGSGFSNYRRLPVQPSRDLCFTFSNLPGQPRIAYLVTGNQVVRFNTATMAIENTGFFPLNLGLFGWLDHDKNDVWFVGLTTDQTTAFAWNSQTNELRTHGESWLNEARLERDGRYIALTNTNSTVRLWDLATNTFGPTQVDNINIWLGHNANLRGQWVTTDVNASAPFDLDRYYPSGGQIAKTRILSNSAGAGVHHSGNWVQSDAELGGNLNRQWSVVSGVDNNAFTATALWKRGIGLVRSDGSDARLLVNHYSVTGSYWADPFAKPSPDGKVVIFNSDMNGSGRYDLFVAEVPLR